MTLVRGDFIKITGAAGAGLFLGLRAPSAAASGALRPNPWVQILPDGGVTVFLNKSEMGQGVATALQTILADELDAPLERVRVEFATADPLYNDPVSNDMHTGGSTSVRNMWMPLRRAGATARAMLVAAAARRWGVDATACVTRQGNVLHPPVGHGAPGGGAGAGAFGRAVPRRAVRVSRSAYARLYGPTTGDRIRLADTELVVEVESDATRYGEEVVFGGGKVVRDGQGQSQRSRAEGAPDLVITS